MRALRLVPCDGRDEPDPVVRHEALTARSRRPGLAHEELVIAPAPEVQSWLVPAAAADGIPAELWAMLVIESERVLLHLDDDPEGRLSVASALDEHARWSAAPADA